MAAAHGHVGSFLLLFVALFRILFELVQIPFKYRRAPVDSASSTKLDYESQAVSPGLFAYDL